MCGINGVFGERNLAQGFMIPIGNWMKEELRPMFENYFALGRLDRQGVFDSQRVNVLFQEHLCGNVRKTNQLWGLLVFQLWYEKMERRLTG